MVDLSSLNANQLEAVNWGEGPLLVLAGPGSGKTRVLTYRIARMVEDTPGKPFRILGLTFTNKAASEMRTRIEEIVPNSRNRIRLTTFHSFCVDLLRQHGHLIGLRPNFTILPQEVDRVAVLDEAIGEIRSDYPDFVRRGEQLLPMVTQLLDDSVLADDALGELRKSNFDEAEVLAATYSTYRRLMIENNQLDFGCLIAEALGLLEGNAAVRRLVSRIYPYVCVDEFQDTNLAQYRILANVVDPSTKNLFVVADDDQIIYQWNGADPRRLNALREDFGVTVLQLPENYRCPPQVVDVANKLINCNLARTYDKAALVAHKSWAYDDVINVESFETFEDEASWVADDITSRTDDARSNCVVLARTRGLLEPVRDALEDSGVPAYIAMRKDEFLSNQMIWLHSVLRLANARQDREQLRRVCKSFFELAGVNLQVRDIISAAAAAEGDYLRAWHRIALSLMQLDPRTSTTTTS
jgi:DNA helicase-2/ATP-dependent DNA helicase PcrA